MRLFVLFDAGFNPIPVIVPDGEHRPEPEDLICRFRGNQSLVDERMNWAQTGLEPCHDYQWLGPYKVPQTSEGLPRPFTAMDENLQEEMWTLDRGPFVHSELHVNEENPQGIVFWIPGYDEVSIQDIPTTEQCQNASEGVGYIVDGHLNG